jgi:3-oxoacyl-[acyl-carrier protein] reductase
MRFVDAKVLVTGACGVFGRWIVQAFAREGAVLCLADRRADALEATRDELGLGVTTLLHPTELMDAASIAELAGLVAGRWGAPDVVVNNAGVYPYGPLLDLEVEAWDRIQGVNVRAPFLLTQAMARLMIGRRTAGSIVMISSGAARKLRNGAVAYCTSKTALERLAQGFALELAPHRIRVNVVQPGFAPGSVVNPLSEEHVGRMRARIPLGRTSGPDDAPEAVLYLCSKAADFVTGAVLAVDGGNAIGTFDPAASASEHWPA